MTHLIVMAGLAFCSRISNPGSHFESQVIRGGGVQEIIGPFFQKPQKMSDFQTRSFQIEKLLFRPLKSIKTYKNPNFRPAAKIIRSKHEDFHQFC